ncbi:MAG: hypothetical protein M1837_002822 [Sclerophora amabilis]|nr:MAG: hypothetical protein M1837_002822 [Sclerophora amabilis]
MSYVFLGKSSFIQRAVASARHARLSPHLARRSLVTLAIETSCDDTSVAVLEEHRGNPSVGATLHFHSKVTSHDRRFQGIHPLVALESHQTNLGNLVNEALSSLPKINGSARDGFNNNVVALNGSSSERKKPDFISVTRGPGMRSNLNVGLDMAKGLSIAWQIPLLAINHMQAHALTPRLVSALETESGVPADPAFPFLSLLVSGGHTMLIHSKELTDHTMLAATSDIAVGDMVDKVARNILPPDVREQAECTMYGQLLERFAFPNLSTKHEYQPPASRSEELASKPSRWGWSFGLPLAEKGSSRAAEFSFSGLESSIARRFTESTEAIDDDERRALAQEAFRVAFEHLASRIVFGLQHLRDQDSANTNREISTLVVSGGVASNDYLRIILRKFLDIRGFSHVRIIFPPAALCVDNAAMIAWTGMEMFEAGWRSRLSCRSLRKWALDPAAEDGGILGVPGWVRAG